MLFDEIEKAHKAVWKVLLNILDEGEMKDNKGNKISFRNTIIVFTTNLGCTKDTGKSVGIGFVKNKETSNSADIMKSLENYFSPEFLGRLDDIVFFDNLTSDILDTLIERNRVYYNSVSGNSIEFSEEDIKNIKKVANVETAGARGLKRAVRKQMAEKE